MSESGPDFRIDYVEFPATVEVVTHENTAKLMPEMRDVYGIQNSGRNVFRDSKGVGLQVTLEAKDGDIAALTARVDALIERVAAIERSC